MDQVTHVALSLATSMERALDVAANNIANANTDGFRAERTTFGAFLAREEGRSEVGTRDYVIDRGSWIDGRAGPFARTGNPLDVALSEDGWLSYRLPDGAIAYGRDGNLTVSPDGVLTTHGGAAVLDEGGADILLPVDASTIAIASDGTITNADGDVVSRLGILDIPDADGMVRVGQGLFAPPPGRSLATVPSDGARVIQGSLEGSNVVPVVEMTRLIEIQRSYERAAQLMKSQDDLSRDAVRRLGRQS